MLKLFVLNSKPSDPNGYIFQSLIRAFCRRSDIQLNVIRGSEMRQIPIDPHNQSLLVYGGEELHQIPRDQILLPFGRRAIWFTEDPYEAQRNQENASLFHSVFTNDTGSLNFYSNAHHLPLAVDPDLMPRHHSITSDKLLFFSGTAWPNRKALLNTLLCDFPYPELFDFHLVANPFVERQLIRRSLNNKSLRFEDPIAISDFVLRAANSICTLVVGRDFSGSGKHNYARSPGPRLFEAGITGSCQLVHASEIPDMPDGLVDGRHFLRFSSSDQLVELLRQAQDNPEPFRAIGEAMSSEIMSHHTYDQRADLIVKTLQNIPSDPASSGFSSQKYRALFISHELTKPGYQFGGAGLCLDQIVSSAPEEVEIRILCRSGDDGHSFILLDRNGECVGGFRCHQKVNEFSLHHPELEEHIRTLLMDWKPRLVHINHLLGFTPGILSLARNSGAITTLTLHDYYVICDSWNLLDNNNKFCGITEFFDDRCQACTTSRRSQFRSVDPVRRRVVMAEALANVHALIAPSRSAEHQLRLVLPHLPSITVIEPSVVQSAIQIKAGDANHLTVLIPGNLSINKGYFDLRSIIDQSNDLGLSIKFQVLGRVESWIQQELDSIPNVKLLGSYEQKSFAQKVHGVDLALFLSPWPETYCITFDEWKSCGRACFYYAIGALAESHRQEGLHQASVGFAADDREGLMSALIHATTPAGLHHLRQERSSTLTPFSRSDFGVKHWSLFFDLMNTITVKPYVCWSSRPHENWVDDSVEVFLSRRQKLKSIIYSIPGGIKLAALVRRIRAR